MREERRKEKKRKKKERKVGGKKERMNERANERKNKRKKKEKMKEGKNEGRNERKKEWTNGRNEKTKKGEKRRKMGKANILEKCKNTRMKILLLKLLCRNLHIRYSFFTSIWEFVGSASDDNLPHLLADRILNKE